MDIAKIRKKLKEEEKEETKETQEERHLEPEGEIEQPEVTSETNEVEQQKIEKTEEKIQEESIEKKEATKDLEEPEGTERLEDEKEEFVETKERKEEIATGLKPEETEEVLEMLSFRLLKEEFAFKINQIAEILRYQRITKVPKTDKYILGITSLRGKIIPVIDLKVKLSLLEMPQEIENKGKILILKGPKGSIGVLVDDVIGVLRIAKKDLQPPPTHLTEKEMKYIEGVAIMDKRFISIINMEEIIPLTLK
jgi:purine-binding chemotaxis protein CheW